MKGLTFIFVVITSVFILTQCTKSSSIFDTVYTKELGQCGEFWLGTHLEYENTSEALSIASRYLADSINVEFEDLKIDSFGVFSVCFTCIGCPSGEAYFIKAAEEDKEVLATLGFFSE